MNDKSPQFSLKFSQTLGYGISFIVLILFLRNFIRFPIALAPLILAFVILVTMILKRNQINLSAPKLSSSEKVLLFFLMPFVAFIVLLHLAKYPLFPFASNSVDFQEHIILTRDYLNGGIPALSGQVLYYGVHYLFAFSETMTGYPNLILVMRSTMALLVILSPLFFYSTAYRIFESETKALAGTVIYSLAAYLWFGMVWNSGLYPNFYGFIASLILIDGSIRSLKAPNHLWLEMPSLGLLLFNALMSHFSIMLLFPPLVICLLLYSKQKGILKRGLLTNGIILAPVIAGLGIFPGIISTAVSFAASQTTSCSIQTASGVCTSPTFLASLFLPLPILSIAVMEITNDVGSAVMFLILLPISVVSAVRSKNWLHAFPLVSASFIVALSPHTDSAWRFAFIALAPLTLAFGSGLESASAKIVSTLSKERGKLNRRFSPKLGVVSGFMLMLFVSPMLYGSWGANAFANSSTDILANNQHDFAAYDAMRWMKTADISCGSKMVTGYFVYEFGSCGSFLTTNDVKFTTSRLLFGRETDFQPSLVTSSQNALLYALQHKIKYIITSDIFPPFPCFNYDVKLLLLNATYGHAIKVGLNIFTVNSTGEYRYHNNASASIFVNDTRFYSFNVIRGAVNGTLAFAKQGTYVLRAEAGVVPSNTLQVAIGSTKPPQSLPVNFQRCYPWFWTSQDLGNAVKAYENSDVRIWCLPDVGIC